jgi:holo-[acyl-carrier protein] synthase
MIKGIGIDVVEISRIENMINKYQNHFIDKVFTEQEKEYCNKMANPAIHFSGRWAAKEAFYKALPNICQQFSNWKSIEITNKENNIPFVKILDNKLKEKIKEANIENIYISISHEKSICAAIVIME